MINIDSYPQSDIGLDSKYKFKKRHLVIDKMYNKLTTNQHGLYLAHYTEEYLHENDHSSIKVHVYLDKNNRCIYVQAKKYDGVTKEIIELPFEGGIIKNSNAASKILQDFLIIRKDSYLQAMQRSHVLEKELCDLISSFFNDKLKFAVYAEKANEFVAIIEEINSYVDDYIDMRGEIIKNILKQLRKKIQTAEVTELTMETITEDYEEDLEVNFIPYLAPPSSSFNEKEKGKLLTKLNDYSIQLHKVQDILKKHNLLQDIKHDLLILTFNEGLMQLLSSKEKEFISRLEQIVYTENNNISEELDGFFLQACFAGDLDKTTQLFARCHFKIDFKFIYSILEEALSVKANTQESLNIINHA